MANQIIEEDIQGILKYNLPWQQIEGSTVLVSGAAGFLPAYMVRTLLHLNCKVIGIVRNSEKARLKFSRYQDDDRLKLIVQDICEPVSIGEKVDYIIHAASQASPKYYGKDPVGTLSANVFGTGNLLKLAKEKEVKGFLFFSSGEVYGELENDTIPVKEEYYGYVNSLDVRSCYAESKRMGENMCISWSHQYGIPTKIVRIFHTYGPGMSLDDGRVFADFVSDILHNRDIIMKSDGSAIRPFCYLADATEGFFTVLLKGKVAQAYNMGNDKGEISIKELAELLVNLYPEKKLRVQMELNTEAKGYIKSKINRILPDVSKICSLGWSPKTSLEEGFRRVISSYE